MRIQRQRDTFAYRVAADAPVVAPPQARPYQTEDSVWEQHTADVERILAARLLEQSKGGGLPDGQLPRDSYYLNGTPVIDKRAIDHYDENGNPVARPRGKRKVSWVLSPERKKLHDQIIEHFMPDIDRVPREKKAILLGGLGGSGKGGILKDMRTGIRLDDNDNPIDYFTINPDTVKEYMASIGAIPKVNGLSPMEASPLTHEEASDIAKELAKRAYEKGANVIWDYTMSSGQSGLDRIKDMKERGYNDFSGIFVDVDGETARKRAMHRWRSGQDENPYGGRALASWTSKDNEAPEGSPFRSKNAEAFDKLAKMGVFNSGYIKYDNTDDPAYQVAGGRPGQAVPRVMEAAGKWAPIGLGAEKPNSRVMAANIRLAKIVQAYIDQGVDPASVRGLLRAYRHQQIDIHQLTEAIISRLAMLEADEDDGDDDSNYFNRAEEMADDDSLWWINSARHRGTLTHQEEDYLFSEIAKADHP